MPRVRRCHYNGCHAMVKLPLHYCEQHQQYEQAYQASRMKWARSHQKQYEHKYNTQVRFRNTESAERYRFYRSRTWQRLRQQVLERDSYLCQYCLVNHLVTEGKTVDHIVAIEIDPSKKECLGNLATICRSCHHLKTQLEQELFGTGKDNHLVRRNPITSVAEWVETMQKYDG